MNQAVYFFGSNVSEYECSEIKRAAAEDVLGNKGANLVAMSKMGLPVPPGFIITTDQCNAYYLNNKIMPNKLKGEIWQAMRKMELMLKKVLGSTTNPLLISVRSGARTSMPGMMDTILNLGLNDKTTESLARNTGNPRFALDSYRRLIQMYSDVVLKIPRSRFEDAISDLKASFNVIDDSELTPDNLSNIIKIYKSIVIQETGSDFPQSVQTQLLEAIEAVFLSWMNERAVIYRNIHNMTHNNGTAVTVQSMVFGNLSNNSATGVVFTRNPSTGQNEMYGEYLLNAQGEDVVSGTRTPYPICQMRESCSADSKKEDVLLGTKSMSAIMPLAFNALKSIVHKLESYYKDMQDIEFTIEDGKLWILQTRSGKRSVNAAIKIAVDMVFEGLLSKTDAILRIDPKSIEKIIHPYIDPNHPRKVVANGLPSSPGSASGIVVFSSADAEEAHRNGHSVILVRHETSPDDISGMHVADGILTSRGGLTSHAAVVARGMGKCCVSGCSDILIDYEKQEFIAKDIVVKKTDIITIDGSSGEVMLGKMPMIMHDFSSEFKTIMMWSDEIGKIAVRANAETVTDCIAAIKYGAMGIGLCRTEHMFLEKSRILTMRQMILADNYAIKQKAIEDLLLEQCRDFIEIFKIINGLPINIRLLDPPIHEFLPSSTEDIAEFCKLSKLHKDHVLATLKHMKEINPMLGHRGVRLGITFPEIYSMQIRAIFSAYIEVVRSNVDVNLEIMLPLVMNRIEFDQIHASIINIQAEMEANSGVQIKYMTGTMIEVPRACIVANEIAKSAEYFSFGTNDLTQAMLCISRDDAFKFLTTYQERGIIDSDPFTTLDLVGVGEMIKMASIRGRSTRPDIKLGLCGEHGGHPDTVKFCAELNFDYVSCSPYRIPIARLAAAQAAISL